MEEVGRHIVCLLEVHRRRMKVVESGSGRVRRMSSGRVDYRWNFWRMVLVRWSGSVLGHRVVRRIGCSTETLLLEVNESDERVNVHTE